MKFKVMFNAVLILAGAAALLAPRAPVRAVHVATYLPAVIGERRVAGCWVIVGDRPIVGWVVGSETSRARPRPGPPRTKPSDERGKIASMR